MAVEVDVVIPVFNAARTLEEAIDSIRAQTKTRLRIIIIDDGSNDGSSAILGRLSDRDDRIEVYRQDNAGIVAALNRGLSLAHAPLLARHDSDDIADPERFERQVDYLRSNQDCVAVSSFARHIAPDGSSTTSLARFRPIEEADAFALPSWEPYLLHPFLLARRWALDEVGGYRQVKHAEDTDLYWRLQEIGRLHVIPEVLGSYRLSVDGISSKSLQNGRVLAVFSQLAALSARRRRAGINDIEFSSRFSDEISCQTGSHSMMAEACKILRAPEAAYLRQAYAAKLLELTSYRPYELESEDCTFIRESLVPSRTRLSNRNRRDLSRARAIAVVRMLNSGRFSAAVKLFTPGIMAESIVRLSILLCRRAIDSLRGGAGADRA